MSESAFGVDHGEIEKAFGRKRAQQRALERQASINRTARRQASAAKQRAVYTKVVNAPKRALNAKMSVADVGRGVGTGFSTTGKVVGTGLTKYPGLTGAAVLGGAGYGLYRHGNKKPKTPTVSKALRFPGVKPFGPGAKNLTKLQPVKGMKASKGKEGAKVPPVGVKKAFGMPGAMKLAKPMTTGVQRMGSSIGQGTSKLGAGMAQAGGKKLRTSSSTFGSLTSLGARNTGLGTQKLGAGMMKRPGLTGGAAVAGAGAGTFALGRNSNQNQRLRQYR